jgi:hypothetical protein
VKPLLFPRSKRLKIKIKEASKLPSDPGIGTKFARVNIKNMAAE